MALDRQQVGLLFKLEAENKSAKAEFSELKEFVAGILEGIQAEARDMSKHTTAAIDDIGEATDRTRKKATKNFDDLGKSSKASANIIKESVETISSEIIESFGVDGDIANELGKQISGLSKTTLIAGGVLVGLTAIVAGTTAALFSLAKGASEVLTEIGDLNEKTGISVETLSALKPTLEQNGADFNKFGSAISELEQKMVKAQGGNKELAAGFKRLGVDLEAGTEPALAQIVKRYNELPEGAERTAFATNVFGSAGEDLVLTLNSLNGNLDEHTAKMKELGLTVTPEAIRQAKQFDKELKTLDTQFQAIKVSIGSAVIPAFTGWLSIVNQMTTQIRELTQGTRSFLNVAAGVAALSTLGFGSTGFIGGNADGTLQPKRSDRTGGPTSGANPLPFGAGNKTKTASTSTLDAETSAKLQLLKIQEAAATRLADAEIQAARRALDEKGVTLQEYEAAVIAAEKRMLEAKQKTFAEEKRLVEESRLKGAPREAKLAEINEREAAAVQRSNEAIARVMADTQKRREQIAKEGEQIREKSAEEHAKRLEEIAKLSDARQIAQIREAAQQKQITEEQAAIQIEAIKIAAFAREEDRLKAELDRTRQRLGTGIDGNDRAKAIAEEQKFIDALKVLGDQRTNVEEEANRNVQAAREKDLENLRKTFAAEADEMAAAIEKRRQLLLQNPASPLSIFGQAGQDSADLGGGLLDQFKASALGTFQEVSAGLTNMEGIFEGAFQGIAQGLGQMIEAFILTGEAGPAAFRKLAAGVLAAVAAQAAVKAIFEVAEGFAALARAFFGDPKAGAEAALHFKSAAIYGAVAAVAGVAGRAIAPSAGGGGGSTTAGAGSEGRGTRTIEQGNRQNETKIIVIRAEYQPGVIVREVKQNYTGNGDLRGTFRSDMLGEPAG